jgi:hypothetical protein
MKVIDLQIYRNKKAIEALEKRISEHALQSRAGSVKEIKTCFREWIKKQAV